MSRNASRRSVLRSIDATWFEPGQETNTWLLSGRNTKSCGWAHTETVLRTANFCVSMSETVLDARLLTATTRPSGETFASPGELPTGIVAITARLSLASSMTDTFDDPELAT